MPEEIVPKPKRKATTWSEAKWTERGFRTLKVRASASVADHFDALARHLGVSRAEALAVLLDGVEVPPALEPIPEPAPEPTEPVGP